MKEKTAPKPTNNEHRLPKGIRHHVGIDVASKSFVATLLTNGNVTATSRELSQTNEGFEALLAWLKTYRIVRAKTVIAMENTGVYNERLCLHLLGAGHKVVVVDGATISRHRSPSTPKSDPADSLAIAHYLHRYADTLRLWQPQKPELYELNQLLSLRELLVRRRTSLKNHRRSSLKRAFPSAIALEILDRRLAEDTREIKLLDKKIKEFIEALPELHHKVELLRTIPGVQILFAANLLLLTEGRAELPYKSRKLANLLGICPHEYSSGTSIKRRARSSRMGPPRLRKLLNLAARSIATHDDEFKAYYERKKDAGKAKMLVLNNIGNDLIRISCAMLREDKVFVPKHRSLHPARS